MVDQNRLELVNMAMSQFWGITFFYECARNTFNSKKIRNHDAQTKK